MVLLVAVAVLLGIAIAGIPGGSPTTNVPVVVSDSTIPPTTLFSSVPITPPTSAPRAPVAGVTPTTLR